MAGKMWKYKSAVSDTEALKNFAEEANIPPIFALLFLNRGITTKKDSQSFIKRSLESIVDPVLLPDADEATKRIVRALENHEKITVYGDYDADGVSATALMVKFLKNHGADVNFYIPNRENEGYGINVMAINKLAKEKTKLLITVDCGITSVGEVELAKALGMDVIITDHHLCKEKLPRATAVINPHREDSEYPFPHLAGAGVGFKLILSVAKALGEKASDTFFEYVDIASVGTIADMVLLMGENRVIAHKGIQAIQEGKNIGIKALCEVSGADKRPINATSVSFMLAPRINACGRIKSADEAVKLLLSEDYEEALKIAGELEKNNNERKTTEQKIYEEALLMIENDASFSEKSVIVLGKEGWHHGVVGIVASKICERFAKPTILVAFDEDGVGKGSGRSVEGFDIFKALTECKDLLSAFGGHSQAAGIGISKSDMDAFFEKFNKIAKEKITEEQKISKIEIECELSPEWINLKNAEMLEYLEPYGEGNPKPLFSISGAKILKIEQMGADFAHLRLTIEKNGKELNAVGFYMGEYKSAKQAGELCDIAFSIDVNEFRGEKRVQLILKDIK